MTNLNRIKQTPILDEVKYFAMLGYSVDNVDFNDESITMVRSVKNTKHPLSLVKFKNGLHVVLLDINNQQSKISATSNSIPAESLINCETYEEFIKANASKETLEQYNNMKMQLLKIDERKFDDRSELLYTHFKSVGNTFRKNLQQHLESVRNVLVNAELCDEDYMQDEIKGLNEKKTLVKTLDEKTK